MLHARENSTEDCRGINTGFEPSFQTVALHDQSDAGSNGKANKGDTPQNSNPDTCMAKFIWHESRVWEPDACNKGRTCSYCRLGSRKRLTTEHRLVQHLSGVSSER